VGSPIELELGQGSKPVLDSASTHTSSKIPDNARIRSFNHQDITLTIEISPLQCSAATFPGRTTPLLTSHITFLRVSFPYPSMLTSIRSDLQPSAVILYPLLRIRISTARILRILCPILVHVCLGSSVSFSPSFPYCFPLLYLGPLLYPLFACPGFSVTASDYFALPFFLLRLTVTGMPGL
jgi:hypothetical protein